MAGKAGSPTKQSQKIDLAWKKRLCNEATIFAVILLCNFMRKARGRNLFKEYFLKHYY
jgi:hypothetical protein